MSNKKDLIMFAALVDAVACYDDKKSFNDICEYASTHRDAVIDVETHMNIELLRMLSNGYTEDEILEILDLIMPKGMKNLTSEEKQIVRNDARKLILKRKEFKNYE